MLGPQRRPGLASLCSWPSFPFAGGAKRAGAANLCRWCRRLAMRSRRLAMRSLAMRSLKQDESSFAAGAQGRPAPLKNQVRSQASIMHDVLFQSRLLRCCKHHSVLQAPLWAIVSKKSRQLNIQASEAQASEYSSQAPEYSSQAREAQASEYSQMKQRHRSGHLEHRSGTSSTDLGTCVQGDRRQHDMGFQSAKLAFEH